MIPSVTSLSSTRASHNQYYFVICVSKGTLMPFVDGGYFSSGLYLLIQSLFAEYDIYRIATSHAGWLTVE